MMDQTAIKRAVIIPDCHIGIDLDGSLSHDVKAIALLMDVITDLAPYYVYILGDFADFHSVSSHDKDPGITSIIKDEVYHVHEVLSKIHAIEKHFICGNHEFRLERKIAKDCPGLFGMVNLQDILKLDQYGFTFHPYGPNQLVQVGSTNLYARHEPYSRSPEASGRKSLCNIISGHNHTINRSIVVSATGESYESISCGSLVNIGHPVFSYLKTKANWQTGFGVVTILPDNSWFYEQVQIKGGRCLFDGVLYFG